MSKYLRASWSSIPAARARVQPGLVLDDLRDSAERHHLTFAPDPSTHRPLYDRRDDRQQLLRRPLRCSGRQDRRQRRGARNRTLRRHAAVARCGRRGRARRDHPRGRPPGRDLHRTRALARALAPTRSGGAIRKFRAASPATTSTSSSRERLQRRARAGRHARARWVTRRSSDASTGTASPTPQRWWYSASTTFTSPPIRCRGFWSIVRRRSRGSTIICPTSRAPRGSTRCACCPTAARFSWSSSARDTRRRAGGGRASDDPGAARRACARVAPLFAASEQRAVWSVRESGLGAGALIQSAAHLAWRAKTPRVPPARLGDYLRRFVRLLDATQSRSGDLLRPLRRGLRPLPREFRFHTAKGVATFRTAMLEIGDLVTEFGGSLSGEHGDGLARASFCPRCLARN